MVKHDWTKQDVLIYVLSHTQQRYGYNSQTRRIPVLGLLLHGSGWPAAEEVHQADRAGEGA